MRGRFHKRLPAPDDRRRKRRNVWIMMTDRARLAPTSTGFSPAKRLRALLGMTMMIITPTSTAGRTRAS